MLLETLELTVEKGEKKPIIKIEKPASEQKQSPEGEPAAETINTSPEQEEIKPVPIIQENVIPVLQLAVPEMVKEKKDPSVNRYLQTLVKKMTVARGYKATIEM